MAKCIMCGREGAMHRCEECTWPIYTCSSEDCVREHRAEHGRAAAYALEEAEWRNQKRLER